MNFLNLEKVYSILFFFTVKIARKAKRLRMIVKGATMRIVQKINNFLCSVNVFFSVTQNVTPTPLAA
jgi:hypothetical protein